MRTQQQTSSPFYPQSLSSEQQQRLFVGGATNDDDDSSEGEEETKFSSSSPSTNQHEQQHDPHYNNIKKPSCCSLEPYIGRLERFELFSTNQCYYLVGCNKTNTSYRVLKMDRTLIERPNTNTTSSHHNHHHNSVQQQNNYLVHNRNNSTVSTHSSSSSQQPPDPNTSHSIYHDNSSSHNATTAAGVVGGGSVGSTYDPSATTTSTANSSTIMAANADNSHTAKPSLRDLSEFCTEDPNVYSQEEIKDMLDMIHAGNRSVLSSSRGGNVNAQQHPDQRGGGLKPIVKAYGIVGFIRFLDCYYLTLITRRAKVGGIGDNNMYTIKNTETIPLKPAERRPGSDNDNADPSSVLLSMWNRGKRSVGLGLSNREIAELRYQGLYQVVDMTKNFYFSYTYDLTRSLQENFLTTTTQPFPPPPFKDMYAWNYFLTRDFEACLTATTSYHWIMPIVHGAFVQRKVNDYGRCLNIILLARRSRHFAGTRYLKRGVSEQGKVANDVEHEQILHDESMSTPGSFSSYLQVRGSIPTFWTQESSVTMPKPPIELNRVDPTYTATRLHFGDLLQRYSSPILVLDLVKQSEKREREVRVGNEYRHAIDYINQSIDDDHMIRYCALDYSHISKHRGLDVSFALNEVSAWAVNQTGFFCSAPKWKIEKGGVIRPFTEQDGHVATRLTEQLGVPVFPMEQNGVLRTNCIDCLDRTNVAQFSAGVEAISQQLVVMGIRSHSKLGPSSSIVRVLIDMYVDIGDSVALQYGGSEAHKKVTAGVSESNITGPIGKHKELLTSIRRYYSNAFTDRLKQDAMNLFLGYYLPYRHSVPLWEMENDYYLHNFHVKAGRGVNTTMKSYERAFGIEWKDEDDLLKQKSKSKRRVSTRRGSLGSGFTGKPDTESERVQLVRNRCKAQQVALSSWWKVALQSNIKQRMWMRLHEQRDDSPLPPRFEQVYQPEKLAQFDRFLARTWEPPVRRSHAAQHSEGIEDEDAVDFSRIISADSLRPSAAAKAASRTTEVNNGEVSVGRFALDYGYSPRAASTLGLFAEHFNRPPVKTPPGYIGQAVEGQPPDEYVRYCAPSNEVFGPPQQYKQDRVDEFRKSLHDYTLKADDVNGIRELAKSAHLGEIILEGEYRGLDKNTPVVEVATVIQEQFNALESLPMGGEQLVERELLRRGFHTDGVREAVSSGWNTLTSAQKKYIEIVEARVDRCERSELTNAESLKLYASEFEQGTMLTTGDRIFLQAYEREKNSNSGELRMDKEAMRRQSTPFVQKAARLGFKINPHTKPPPAAMAPLYHSEQRYDLQEGFEQINEDMYARKDNKFMVFNRVGVNSWHGTQPRTKTSSTETILLSTLN